MPVATSHILLPATEEMADDVLEGFFQELIFKDFLLLISHTKQNKTKTQPQRKRGGGRKHTEDRKTCYETSNRCSSLPLQYLGHNTEELTASFPTQIMHLQMYHA